MSIDSTIEGLVSRHLKTPAKVATPPSLKGTVVTVARSCGAGGEEVAYLLAERLGLRCYDADLVQAIAEEAKADKQLMARLDEHTEHLMNGWLRSIITGKGAFSPEYRRALVSVVLGISHGGGVIVGRGANFVLSGKNVFRVRTVCSLPVCVERVAKDRGIKKGKAEKMVLRTDKLRDKFLRKLYPANVHASSSYDLTVNTDHLSYEQAVEIILFAMKQKGYKVPEPKTIKAKSAG